MKKIENWGDLQMSPRILAAIVCIQYTTMRHMCLML